MLINISYCFTSEQTILYPYHIIGIIFEKESFINLHGDLAKSWQGVVK